MKLAEALKERADLTRKIAELRSRLVSNSLVQEGEKTAEDPQELLRELDGAAERLQYLMARINLTNCRTAIDGVSVTELIAKKDVLTLKLAAYREIIGEASQSANRARYSEIKILPSLDVRALQKAADGIAQELRLTDNALQAQNWLTDLIEE